MNKKQKQSSTTPARTAGGRAPGAVIAAAGIAVLQSIAVIIFGIFLVVRELTGAENDSMVSDSGAAGFVGLGTAIFVFIVFGFVIVASWAFVKGKRWGRGAIVLVEFILGAIAFQMFSGGSAALGVVTLASAAVVLYLLMMRREAAQWAESHF
ncbi:hypothetical protein [Corynebacterium aurimucosum]|uniref:Putative membrane protein n=1 Tax=Corynebacterium aurimucosum (strain ATCC 700975 / DSM 44827 / CIP 107346 / CN-1) TaxID=548476 RepID=C3PEN5_CORA7|nr:hypothetical protein [Corynebacterium aurimucosum]ACP32289.1 putative membrane protein [Corynebacterium aurimucosum ATCC 700975]QQU93521.1 hypothetical protein I6I67_02210 [Corynebacterium aurimucosum]